MRSAIEAAAKLADVTKELADQRAKEQRSRLTRRQWLYLAGCATAGAVAPYVVLLFH
jgi:CHASE3 domain sensor protein